MLTWTRTILTTSFVSGRVLILYDRMAESLPLRVERERLLHHVVNAYTCPRRCVSRLPPSGVTVELLASWTIVPGLI